MRHPASAPDHDPGPVVTKNYIRTSIGSCPGQRLIAALLLLTTALPAHAAEPRFIERAADLGIAHVYDGGWEHFVGGGVASFDCNGDDLPELYAAGGANPAMLLRNTSTPGTLAFADETPEGLALTGVTGAYPLDIDGDGHLDLVILRVGENRVMKGGPDCEFAPMPFDSADRWTTAFSAMWEGGATLPTLAFGNYVDRTDPEGPFEACDTNTLYRPDGGAYGAALPLAPGYCALSMLFTDWGRRGRADLRVSNDRHYYVRGGAEQMWAMEDAPRLYTAGDGWRDHALWGMGIASRDITGDGLPEIYLTSMGDQRLQVLASEAGPRYEDAPYDTGATAHRPYTGGDGRPSTGWHAAFGDVDNDGRDDLFVAKGNVEQMPSNAADDPDNLLMQGADGRFVEAGAAAGLASMARGRGAVVADLDLDGRLDIAVVNRRAPMRIYRNVTAQAGGWLLLSLSQSAPNVDAVGAFIEVETAAGMQTREVTVGGGHVGGSAGWHHFGLGEADTARARVIWPDGTASDWREIAANGRTRIAREE